jgi:Glutaredoxin and related proteins
MITIYTKPQCPHCVAAKSYLSRNDIPFREVNVMADENALNFLKSRGHKTVPQLYVGDTLFVEGGNAALHAMTPDAIRARLAELSGNA